MFKYLKNKVKGTNSIQINGKAYVVTGKNISVINDKVYVDGELVEEGLSGNVTISFEGDLASLRTDNKVVTNGSVYGDVVTRGSATISGNVDGDVDAGGSVSCKNVGGDVDAGGSVTCGNVAGGVDAGGSIHMKK